MHQSAEINTTGKTMGDFAKRDTPSINKTALQNHKSGGLSLHHPFSHQLVLLCPYRFLTTVFTYKHQLLFEEARGFTARSQGVVGVKLRERADSLVNSSWAVRARDLNLEQP